MMVGRMRAGLRSLCAWIAVSALVLFPGGAVQRSGPGPSIPRRITVETSVVASRGPNGQYSRLAAGRDDLYSIDAGSHIVDRYILNGLPYAELFTQVMRWKEGDAGRIMGQPLDLFLVGRRLLILDSLGSLWSYWGPDYGRVLVPLRLQSNQGVPLAVAQHGPDLFLLDPGKQQIWQYAQVAGAYNTVPRPLVSRGLAALRGGVRWAITIPGIMVLRSDGALVAIPWDHPDRPVRLRVPAGVTGIWGSDFYARFFVSWGHEVALLAPGGAVAWRVQVGGLGGETIRDLAWSKSGRLFVITPTRILLVHAAVPRP